MFLQLESAFAGFITEHAPEAVLNERSYRGVALLRQSTRFLQQRIADLNRGFHTYSNLHPPIYMGPHEHPPRSTRRSGSEKNHGATARCFPDRGISSKRPKTKF